jgi:hypothetical protein
MYKLLAQQTPLIKQSGVYKLKGRDHLTMIILTILTMNF